MSGATVLNERQVEMLEKGIEEFNRREFFKAHETWEDLWNQLKEHPQRKFLQGLIQIAAAFHKGLKLGNPAGMRTLLNRGLANLEPFLPGAFGVECFHFYPDILECRDEATRLIEGEITEFNRDWIPQLSYQRVGRSTRDTRS